MELQKIDFENPKLLYLQVADIIEGRIKSSKFAVGEKIPPERELLKTFGVSLGTVKEALGKLEREGYLSRRPSIGTVVINSKPQKNLDLRKKNEICLIVCPPEKDSNYNDSGTDEHIQKVIRGVEEKVTEKGCFLIYSSFSGNEISFARKIDDIAGLIVTGVVTRERFRVIKKLRVPFVLIGDIWEKTTSRETVDIIANDDFQGSYMATRHLIGLGHRNIVYFSGTVKSCPWWVEQFNGYKEALREASIGIKDEFVVETGKYGIETGYLAMKKLLGKPVKFSAVYCTSDSLGMGVLKAIREKGLRIPEDISVVGEGSREITTTGYDYEEMGRKAFERLSYRLSNPAWKPERVIVRNRLIIRDSTRKI